MEKFIYIFINNKRILIRRLITLYLTQEQPLWITLTLTELIIQ